MDRAGLAGIREHLEQIEKKMIAEVNKREFLLKQLSPFQQNAAKKPDPLSFPEK